MRTDLNKRFSLRWLTVALGLCLGAAWLHAEEKDEVTASSPAPAATAAAEATKAAEIIATNASEEVTSNATVNVKPARVSARPGRGGGDNPKVVIGNDAEVREGETVDAFVVIGGNGVVKGNVHGAAVVVGGNLNVSGEVDDAVVAVLGTITLHSNAVVKGDAVSVGGKLDMEDGAKVMGETQAVEFGPLGLPQIQWLASWFKHCALKLRLLAPQVGWAWAVAGVIFLFYLLVSVVLPKPVQICVGEIHRRPVTTFLTGLLTKLIVPIVMLILAVTGVGLIVLPFLSAALFFASILGKIALLEYIGDALRRAVGGNEPLKPAIALCAGSALILICYNVPVLGLLTYGITAVWGLGVGVTAAFASLKREAPPKSATPATPAAMPAAGPAGFVAPMPVTTNPEPAAPNPPLVAPVSALTAEAGPAPAAAGLVNPNPPLAATALLPGQVPEALAYPRAAFWERMGAAFLDLVLAGILMGIASNLPRPLGNPPLVFLVALAYFAGMWTWKGTTIGGVVLNLKVVRLDNQPVTFAVALVRGLAAAFSAMVFFLGFLWIIWDQEKQGWHDRIAGTVVVRLPRGTPLVMF